MQDHTRRCERLDQEPLAAMKSTQAEKISGTHSSQVILGGRQVGQKEADAMR